jgi:hypothetical protein
MQIFASRDSIRPSAAFVADIRRFPRVRFPRR